MQSTIVGRMSFAFVVTDTEKIAAAGHSCCYRYL